ncbi:MAG: hypothetical protein KDK37_00775 [Leptospiraceae bacterium]|nr:hypothetical protein [Leptospiraceae bacterium]
MDRAQSEKEDAGQHNPHSAHQPANHLDADLQEAFRKREMQVEHWINIARLSLFLSAVFLDGVTALLIKLPSTGYLLFYVGIAALTVPYLIAVHFLSGGKKYRGWLKYATTAMDLLVVCLFYSFMQTRYFQQALPSSVELAASVMYLILLTFLSALRSGRKVILYTSALSILVSAGMAFYSDAHIILRLWAPAAVALSGALSYALSRNFTHTFELLRKRERLTRYLSRELVDEMDAGHIRAELGGETVEATVLFSDIRGFTTLSEDMSPEAVVSLLNDHFTALSSAVEEYGGTVDKYIGDAIMAVFGLGHGPLAKTHGESALRAAEAILAAVEKQNERRPEDRRIRIGVGLHTGPVVAGNIGSPSRMDYTVIGDTVNLASRLEGLNKKLGTSILLSTSTKALIDRPTSFLGKVNVRGRHGEVGVFTINDTVSETIISPKVKKPSEMP